MGDSFTESWCTLVEKRLMVNQKYGDTLDRLFFTLLDFCLQIPIGILYSLKQSTVKEKSEICRNNIPPERTQKNTL